LDALTAPPDISQIEILFRRLDLAIGPAECHGTLCGMLCANNHVNGAAWAAQILGGNLEPPSVVVEMPVEESDSEGRRLLVALFVYTVEQLEDPNYGFALLLPGDEHALKERAQALSMWCQGFLLGLGLGGVQNQVQLPGGSNEVMRDLVEISKLDHGDGEGDDEEAAYAEIVEYVRMAVLLIYEEFRPLRAIHPKDGMLH
jgi:uncharacterized protein